MRVNYEPQAPVVKLVTTEGSIGNKVDSAIEQYGVNLGTAIKTAATLGAAGLAGHVLLKDHTVLENLKFVKTPNPLTKAFVQAFDGISTVAETVGNKFGNLKFGAKIPKPLAKTINILKGTESLASKVKALPTKVKVVGTLAAVTLPVLNKIFMNHAYNKGRIDQKYETRAQMQKNMV